MKIVPWYWSYFQISFLVGLHKISEIRTLFTAEVHLFTCLRLLFATLYQDAIWGIRFHDSNSRQAFDVIAYTWWSVFRVSHWFSSSEFLPPWSQLILKCQTRYFSKGSIIADSSDEAKVLMVITSGQVLVHYHAIWNHVKWRLRFFFPLLRWEWSFLWTQTTLTKRIRKTMARLSSMYLDVGANVPVPFRWFPADSDFVTSLNRCWRQRRNRRQRDNGRCPLGWFIRGQRGLHREEPLLSGSHQNRGHSGEGYGRAEERNFDEQLPWWDWWCNHRKSSKNLSFSPSNAGFKERWSCSRWLWIPARKRMPSNPYY